MSTSLFAFPRSRVVTEVSGRMHVQIEDRIYRLRFWSDDEWTSLAEDHRPANACYSHWLGCWVGAVPAPQLNN